MDFTNAEKERINQLYGTDFENITPEDALLIGRWEAWKATQESGSFNRLLSQNLGYYPSSSKYCNIFTSKMQAAYLGVNKRRTHNCRCGGRV